MPVIYYEGDRIYLRPVELEDEPRLREWVNHPQMWSTLGFRPPMNGVAERRWIEGLRTDGLDFVFAIVVKGADRMIGTAGLHHLRPVDRKALFGIMIGDRQQQDRGYGSEATQLLVRFGFEELNLNRIELCVYDFNPRAIRVYEKAGFELEGRLRQAVFRHGRYHDELRYAILRDRWQGLQPGEDRAAVAGAS